MTLQRLRGSDDRRQLRILAAGLASAALLVGVMAPAAFAAPTVRTAAAMPGVHSGKFTPIKITANARLMPLGSTRAGVPATDVVKPAEKEGEGPKQAGFPGGQGASLAIPVVSSVPITGPTTITPYSNAKGWDALSGNEMRYASPDGSRWNYSSEPPDQGLCVGNGFVMEAINGAIRIFNATGAPLTDPTPTNQFIGYPKEYPAGPSVGDPRCVYDPQSQRFYLTSYVQGGLYSDYGTVFAFSNTADPVNGGWTTFEIPDLGDGSLDGCQYSCFPDYPQLGLDQNGVWITTNEFDFGNPYAIPYAGVSILGISKSILTGYGVPYGYFWTLGMDQGGVPLGFTLEPSSSPKGGYDRTANGTQYFMATRDMDGTKDNVVDVWSIGNTAGLAYGVFSSTPAWDPQVVHVKTQTYACDCSTNFPYVPAGGAVQKPGAFPLGTSLGEPLPKLSTNDDRMHNVVYSNGALWGAATSAMTIRGYPGETTGIAWWSMRVNGYSTPGHLAASVQGQGYLGAANTYLFFPAVGMTGSTGLITMAMTGPGMYPSVGWSPLTVNGAQAIRTAVSGVQPADGFSGYPEYYPPGQWPGTERWGDYSATATDERGVIYFATEYTTPKPRSQLLNYGTWIGYVFPNWPSAPAPTPPPTAPN